jgi:hypothetical protein
MNVVRIPLKFAGAGATSITSRPVTRCHLHPACCWDTAPSLAGLEPSTSQPWLAMVDIKINPMTIRATNALPVRLPGFRILALLSNQGLSAQIHVATRRSYLDAGSISQPAKRKLVPVPRLSGPSAEGESRRLPQKGRKEIPPTPLCESGATSRLVFPASAGMTKRRVPLRQYMRTTCHRSPVCLAST